MGTSEKNLCTSLPFPLPRLRLTTLIYPASSKILKWLSTVLRLMPSRLAISSGYTTQSGLLVKMTVKMPIVAGFSRLSWVKALLIDV